LLLDHLEGRGRRSHADRAGAERGDVRKRTLVGDRRLRQGQADGLTVRHPLRAGEYVRFYPVLLDAPPFAAGATPGGLDLVRDEQPSRIPRDGNRDLEVLLGRG